MVEELTLRPAGCRHPTRLLNPANRRKRGSDHQRCVPGLIEPVTAA
jgi:hypothetical protein